jgi:predicted dehydrogenase
MKTIRLGIIGTGLAWERLHYPAIKELGDKYEIVALANRTKADAEQFAKKINLGTENIYSDYMEMLQRNDIDAIDIVVPIEMNYEVSENVAKTGFDFICEKPLAPDMEQAKKFLDLSKRYTVRIMIAENFRYNEENNKIKEIVESGRIGEVVYFMKNNVTNFPADMTRNSYAQTEWRQHPDYPGGAFYDAAIHDLAGMRHIFGAVESVQAYGKPQKMDFNPFLSINTNILFKSGVIGYFVYYPSGNESLKPGVGFRIFGTQGEIYLEDKKSGTITVAMNDGTTDQIGYTPERGYYNEMLNFHNALNGIEEISVTPEIEYGDAKMVFDILDSIPQKQLNYVDEPITRDLYHNTLNMEQRPYLH